MCICMKVNASSKFNNKIFSSSTICGAGVDADLTVFHNKITKCTPTYTLSLISAQSTTSSSSNHQIIIRSVCVCLLQYIVSTFAYPTTGINLHFNFFSNLTYL